MLKKNTTGLSYPPAFLCNKGTSKKRSRTDLKGKNHLVSLNLPSMLMNQLDKADNPIMLESARPENRFRYKMPAFDCTGDKK